MVNYKSTLITFLYFPSIFQYSNTKGNNFINGSSVK